MESLYENFRGRAPRKVARLTLPPVPRALMSMGYVSAIEYETTSPRAQGYRHRFSAGSRPLLATDGKHLYVLKGRFRVTARGIVDIDSDGHEED